MKRWLLVPWAWALATAGAGCFVTQGEFDHVNKAQDNFQVDLNETREYVQTLSVAYREMVAWKGGIDAKLDKFRDRLDTIQSTVEVKATEAVTRADATLQKVEQEVVPRLTEQVRTNQQALEEQIDAQNALLRQVSSEVGDMKGKLDGFQGRLDTEIARLSKILRAADEDAIRLSNLQVQRQLLEKEKVSLDARLTELDRQVRELEEKIRTKEAEGPGE